MNRFNLMAEVIVLFYINTEQIEKLKRQINTTRKSYTYVNYMTFILNSKKLFQTIKYKVFEKSFKNTMYKV